MQCEVESCVIYISNQELYFENEKKYGKILF